MMGVDDRAFTCRLWSAFKVAQSLSVAEMAPLHNGIDALCLMQRAGMM